MRLAQVGLGSGGGLPGKILLFLAGSASYLPFQKHQARAAYPRSLGEIVRKPL